MDQEGVNRLQRVQSLVLQARNFCTPDGSSIDREKLAALLAQHDVKVWADLAAEAATVIVAVVSVAKPIAEGLRVSQTKLDAIHNLISPQTEISEFTVQLVAAASQRDYVQIGAMVATMYGSNLEGLIDAIGLLVRLMVMVIYNPFWDTGGAILRAARLRLAAYEARKRIMAAPWCGDCATQAMNVLDALDDGPVTVPADDLIGGGEWGNSLSP